MDSLSVIGPLGNRVSGFWNSKKFAVDQLHAPPHDTVSKLPEKCSSAILENKMKKSEKKKLRTQN